MKRAILVLILVVSIPVVGIPKGDLTSKSSAKNSPKNRPELQRLIQGSKSPAMVFENDVEVRNSKITGSVEVYGQSEVVLDNVVFYVDYTFIEVMDNAKLIINNSKFLGHDTNPTVYIHLYDNATLYISNTTIDISISWFGIETYNQSYLYLENIRAITRIEAYDSSIVYLGGNISDTYIYAFNQSIIMCYGANLESTPITGHDYARIYVYYSNAWRFYIFDIAMFMSYDSQFDELSGDGSNSVYMYFSNVTDIDLVGEDYFWVENCTISSSFTVDTYDTPNMLGRPGSYGYIINSDIGDLYLYTFQVININNSHISYLHYAKVYEGDLVINETDTIYDTCYDNYVAYDTTIDLSELTSHIFVMNSNNVRISRVDDPDHVYLYNVTNAYFDSKDAWWFYVYAWNSNVDIANCTLRYLHVMAYYSSVDIVNISVNGSITVDVEGSFVYMENIYSVYVTHSSIYMKRSMLLAENVTMEQIRFSSIASYASFEMFNFTNGQFFTIKDNSYVDLSDGKVNTSIELYDSYLSLNNTNVSQLYIKYFMLANGTFEIREGVIDISSSSGDTLNGVFGYANYNVDRFTIDKLEIRNATVTLDDIFSYLYYGYFCTSDIYLYNSSLYGNGVCGVNIELDMYAYNSSIYLESSSIDFLDAENSTLVFNSTNVTEIDLTRGTIKANYSYFDEISIIGDSEVFLYMSNITHGLHTEMSEETIFGELMLPIVNVTAIKTNISELGIVGFGSIELNSCVVEYLYYTFGNATIIDTNITGVLLNNTLFTSGTNIIENNKIVSGSGTSLLNIVGDCHINSIANVLVVEQSPTGPPVSLEVYNSMYLGILGYGGSIRINSTYLNVIFMYDMDSLTMYNVTVNATMFEELMLPISMDYGYIDYVTFIQAIPIFSIEQGYLHNVTLDSPFVVFYNTSANLSHVDVTYIDGVMIMLYSRLLIDNSHIPGISTMNSQFDVNTTTIVYMEIENSTCSMVDSVVYGDTLIVHDNAFLDIEGSKIDFLIIPSSSESIKNISISVRNTNITDLYTKYYVVTNHRGVLFDNETITGIYDTRTKYIDVQAEGVITIAFFEVVGYGKTIIEDYTGKSEIAMLWVNTTVDTNPPTIECLNGSYIEYELGLSEHLFVKMNDETPTEFVVYLNDSEIMRSEYVENYTLYLDLTPHITSPGFYIIKIVANDSEGNQAKEEVNATVFPSEPPVITLSPNDTYSIKTNETKTLIWKAEDRSPDIYKLYINGEEIYESTWSSGEEITYNFSTNYTGTYNVTIVFYDKVGLYSMDTVQINVTEITTTTTTTVTEEEKKLNYPLILAIVGVLAAGLIAIIILRKRKAQALAKQEEGKG